MTLALLVNRDDQILLADPGYPCNRHFVRTLEGEAVGVAVGPDSNYQLDAGLIAQAWGPRTRGALIASPSNPTGTTVPHDELRRIVSTVSARGGALIVDEIYLGLSYDAKPRSALALSDDLFVISSFSKYFNMTGWRLGWLVAPERHVRDIEKLAQNLYISPPTLSQRAALACFLPDTLEKFKEVLERPYGLVLVCGPTGSGKSTTLYAALNSINNPDVKILTAENPVEYNLAGIIQTNVNPEIGFTFAEALRAFLRQDPDIIMVGEIRDKETAQIAMEAAMLAPNAEVSMFPWKQPKERIPLAVRQIRSFLRAHRLEA